LEKRIPQPPKVDFLGNEEKKSSNSNSKSSFRAFSWIFVEDAEKGRARPIML